MLFENALIIFIKYPQAGRVKTRLAKTIGKDKAAVLYKNLAESIVRKVQSDEFKTIIFYTPQNRKSEIIRWLGKDLQFYPQKGKDLGERLSNAFKEVFKLGAKKVIVIGSDSLFIGKRTIEKAFSKLKNYQCVIGPSDDGGYYLLGLKQHKRGLFKGIPWSSNEVYDITTDIARKLGLSIYCLDKLLDIDTEEDLRKLAFKGGEHLFYK